MQKRITKPCFLLAKIFLPKLATKATSSSVLEKFERKVKGPKQVGEEL